MTSTKKEEEGTGSVVFPSPVLAPDRGCVRFLYLLLPLLLCLDLDGYEEEETRPGRVSAGCWHGRQPCLLSCECLVLSCLVLSCLLACLFVLLVELRVHWPVGMGGWVGELGGGVVG